MFHEVARRLNMLRPSPTKKHLLYNSAVVNRGTIQSSATTRQFHVSPADLVEVRDLKN